LRESPSPKPEMVRFASASRVRRGASSGRFPGGIGRMKEMAFLAGSASRTASPSLISRCYQSRRAKSPSGDGSGSEVGKKKRSPARVSPVIESARAGCAPVSPRLPSPDRIGKWPRHPPLADLTPDVGVPYNKEREGRQRARSGASSLQFNFSKALRKRSTPGSTATESRGAESRRGKAVGTWLRSRRIERGAARQ
jgi:hypothetical protein